LFFFFQNLKGCVWRIFTIHSLQNRFCLVSIINTAVCLGICLYAQSFRRDIAARSKLGPVFNVISALRFCTSMVQRRIHVDFVTTARSVERKNSYKSIQRVVISFFFFLHDLSFPQTCIRRHSWIITMMKCDLSGGTSFRTHGSVKIGDLLLKPYTSITFLC